MKSYLSLIPISAKVHKRQHLMTRMCILFAVFLVTAVFSMAEMGVRMELSRLQGKHGNESLSLQKLVDNPAVQTLFSVALVLFMLILIAGVLMIAGSINSNVAMRTRFFGMMRCIGMSRQQITNFVRLEALNWCKSAIPLGVALGIMVTWGLCAVLHFFVGEEFSDIPVFGISIPGIISGIILGVVTVLIAARTPARRAAKMSPVTAVSGNIEDRNIVQHTIKSSVFKIETTLGVNHAISVKKTWFLLTMSYALSIVLFLSFSAIGDLVSYLMPQFANTSDLDISSGDGLNSVDSELTESISRMAGVQNVYGRRSCLDISAEIMEHKTKPVVIDMISYDDFDLDCLIKDRLLKRGSDITKVYGDSSYVLTVEDTAHSLEIGDKIRVNDNVLEIAGMLKYNPFSPDGSAADKITLISSGATFTHITGVSDYSLIMIQTAKDITEEEVAAIKDTVGDIGVWNDKRDQRTTGTYLAFHLFIYGFLIIITLVTILNIVNSISMSVSARTKQYGVMRAVGMTERQITKMIATEVFAYTLSGCVVGCVAGLSMNRLIYDKLIITHFSYAVWHLPLIPLMIILIFVAAAAMIAVWIPAGRIRNMEITDTINEV